MATSKIAISLPPELLRLVDHECRARGMNRSEFIRHSIAAVFQRRAERDADAEYEEAYRKTPEDPVDSEIYLTMASAAIGSLPWDE